MPCAAAEATKYAIFAAAFILLAIAVAALGPAAALVLAAAAMAGYGGGRAVQVISAGPRAEPFEGSAGIGAGALQGAAGTAISAGWPGAFDQAGDERALYYGSEDRPAAAEWLPSGRTAAAEPAPACADDEANDAEIDGDERMVYSALGRNDPVRPAAGTMNRGRMLPAYLREEVEKREDDVWWGRNEY